MQGVFSGYNATVFAYGQTGSGKTYTMGSQFIPNEEPRGVIPDALNSMFTKIAEAKDTSFSMRVGFIEIHKVRPSSRIPCQTITPAQARPTAHPVMTSSWLPADGLVAPAQQPLPSAEHSALQEEIHDLLLEAGSAQPAIHLRELPNGSMCVAGATEIDIDLEAGAPASRDRVLSILEAGSMTRATSMTLMNARSSRSHAVFSVTLEQRQSGGGDEESGTDTSYLCAKMLLVDLAGSERVKRTGATGARLQEGIHINQGAPPPHLADAQRCS